MTVCQLLLPEHDYNCFVGELVVINLLGNEDFSIHFSPFVCLRSLVPC